MRNKGNLNILTIYMISRKADVIPDDNRFPSLVWAVNNQLNSTIDGR